MGLSLRPHRASLREASDFDEGKNHEKSPKNEQALLDAQKAQDIYWAALPALEKALGVEVDGTQDLRETTIEYLLEQGKA